MLYEFWEFEKENETYASILNERRDLHLPDETATIYNVSTMTWPGDGFDYSVIAFDTAVSSKEAFHSITQKEQQRVNDDINSLQDDLDSMKKTLDMNYVPDFSKGYFFYKIRTDNPGEHIWLYYKSNNPRTLYIFELLT